MKEKWMEKASDIVCGIVLQFEFGEPRITTKEAVIDITSALQEAEKAGLERACQIIEKFSGSSWRETHTMIKDLTEAIRLSSEGRG